MASFLRAATALCFPGPRAFVISHISKLWTSDLSQFDSSSIPFALETVLLARECHIDAILKRSLYELLRRPCFGINRLKDDDVIVLSGDDSDSDAGSHNDSKKILPVADFLLLTHAREQLVEAWDTLTRSPPDLACHSPNTNCKCTCLQVWYQKVHASGLHVDFRYDPIEGLSELTDVDWVDAGYCVECTADRRELWNRSREKLWQNLDIWLELQSSA